MPEYTMEELLGPGYDKAPVGKAEPEKLKPAKKGPEGGPEDPIDTAQVETPVVWTVIAYVMPKGGAVVMAVDAETPEEAAKKAFGEYCDLEDEMPSDAWKIIAIFAGVHIDHAEDAEGAFALCKAA